MKTQPQITLFIGPPGCGKSFKIRQLKDEYKENVLIFSPTNSNNQICHGQTIFRYLNCTPLSLDKAKIKKIKQELVIFDEIFMITAEQFNAILKCEPQKIYCFGDPYQIHQTNQSYFYRDIDTSKVKIELMTTYYRATDQKLIQILNQYRIDKQLKDYSMFPLLDQKLISHYVQKLEWTLLVGKKRAITYYGRKMKYDFTDKSGTMWYYGQRVMIINQYNNCVKISQIQSYDYESGIIRLTTTEEMKPKKRGNKVYYLLDRADIITVNLSQGLTLKGVLIDFGSFFEYGSAYTAISRVKELKQIKIISRPVIIQEADLSNEFIY